jgi:hypothetical protein
MQLTITIDDRKAFLKPLDRSGAIDADARYRPRRIVLRQPDKTMEHRRIEAVTEPPSPR